MELKNFLEKFKFSSLYLTKPWGISDQRDYLNAFAVGYTDLSPREILIKIWEIENRYGRRRKYKFSPRTLDIDIIFYEDLVLKEKDLKIPHPLMHKRNFVLIPMHEIEKEWVHPVLKKKVSEIIINDCKKEVKKVIDRKALRI